MSGTTTTGQFQETTRMSVHEIARELVHALGPTLVAAMTGSKDRKLPSRWAKDDGPEPGPDFVRRLQYGHRAWRTVASTDGAHVARQWFIGGNPVLGEVTPLTAIRADRGGEVITAADSFIHGDPDA
jgi:hypothetical protein